MKDQYRIRFLQSNSHYKPLDFSMHGLTGSVNRDGRIISLNTYHHEYGYVTVTSLPPFDESQRYSPAAVRAYRRSVVSADGFGLRLDGLSITNREYGLIEDAIPYLRFELEDGKNLEIVTFAAIYQNVPHAFYWCLNSADLGTIPFDGRVWIQRCAYSQLTEGGPLPMPSVATRFVKTSASGIELINDALETKLTTNIEVAENNGDSVRFNTQLSLNGIQVIVLRLDTHNDQQHEPLPSIGIVKSLLDECVASWKSQWQGWKLSAHPLDIVLRRALVYAQSCCVPVDDRSLCVITDHQLLPLSWTRDAYYTIMPLIHWRPEFAESVRQHLLWLFECAERTDGHWGRAYLANGKVKDAAMQLDQQLYPLLELAEYTLITDDKSLWNQLEETVHLVIEMLLNIRDESTRLFPTKETPADDPVHLPFHLSSHILFWHTLHKLAQVTHPEWALLAEEIRQAVQRHFVTDWQGKPIYAYLTDGAGNYHLYQDANDLPLPLAPLWGFCSKDDGIWQNTMAFSFSPDNVGGYYGEATDSYPGLGSVHTPDAWHLGSVQELLYAQITGNQERENQIIEKIVQTMQWDGALSEGFSAKTGDIVSRHWFAWPNAALHLCSWS